MLTVNERQRRYLSKPANMEKHKARMRAYYIKNKAKIRARHKARYLRIKEEKMKQKEKK